MYLGSWKIDDYLTFPVNTHTPATGAATDTDSVPTYRVYEDDTGTAIENGSLAKLDDSNTTGFYVLRIQLDAATGYEAGKHYTIYVSATVGSVVGTLSHTFQVQAEVALHSDWVNGGRLDLLIDAIKAVTDDWADGQRLDLIIDAIKAVTDNLPDAGALTTLITHLTDIKGGTFSGATDSLEAIRDRGDTAWLTGGAGSIADMLNVQALIPHSIDLANTATVRLALGLTNMLDDLPVTSEITPGTISIDRKAAGGTSWSSVVSDASCSAADGVVYYDEVFDTGTGYSEGDSIRITFKNQLITVDANDFEITGSAGWIFQTSIRETMRGTDSAALATELTNEMTAIKGAGFVGGTDSLEAIRDRGDTAWTTGGAFGSGSNEYEYSLTSTVGGTPITDADVWVTTDAAGANVVASGRTDAFGKVTFYLDAGNYYFWRQKSGWNFSNPDVEVLA